MTVAKSLEQQASVNFTVNHGKGVQYFANLHVCCEDGMPCCNDVFAKVVEDTYKSTRGMFKFRLFNKIISTKIIN